MSPKERTGPPPREPVPDSPAAAQLAEANQRIQELEQQVAELTARVTDEWERGWQSGYEHGLHRWENSW